MASPSRPCRKRPARRSSLPDRPFSSRPAAAPGGPPRRSTRRAAGAPAGLRGHFPRVLPSSFPSSRFVRRRCRNGRRRSQFRAIPGAVFELPEHRRSTPRRIAPGNRHAHVTLPRHQLGSIPRIREKEISIGDRPVEEASFERPFLLEEPCPFRECGAYCRAVHEIRGTLPELIIGNFPGPN